MKSILLADLVNKTSIIAGQIIIPLDTLKLDYLKLEEILKFTLAEYERYKPNKITTNTPIRCDQSGIYLEGAKRVVSIRPYVGRSIYEFVTPIDFRSYELDKDTNILRTSYAGLFILEYLSDYRIGNIDVSYNYTDIYPMERQFKFKLKGHFKKGTLIIAVINGTTAENIVEDFASYQTLSSDFTINTITNILTIDSDLGSILLTGSEIILSNTGGALPTNLTLSKYYVIKISDTQIKLATSQSNALKNVFIIPSDAGTSINTLTTSNNPAYVNILSSFAYGKINLKTLDVELNFISSKTGKLEINFTSLYIGIENIDENEVIFTKLFQANLMTSLGLIKEILKLDEVPFDFSQDTIYNRGEALKKEVLAELVDTAKWWEFRS